jgi:hypothetical protein
VLFAWATGDKAVSWGRSRTAAMTVHDRSIELFAGGHAAFLEAPDAFDAALLKFVAAKVPQAATPQQS